MRSARRQFAATILALESLLVVFATLVAFGLRVAQPAMIWAAGGTLAVALVVAAGLLRHPGGYLLGSVLQALVLAAGLVVPMMYVIGGVFVVLWVVALRLGGRIDRERAQWSAGTPDG